MKKRGQIWSSLLILGLLSMYQFSFAQEENFNLPGDERRSESRRTQTGLEGEYMNDSYTTEPKKKEDKSAHQKVSTSSYNDASEVNRENGPTTPDTHLENPPQVQNQPASSTGQKRNESQVQPEEQQDESVLSFNVLYYMIQKFKFSDVIE